MIPTSTSNAFAKLFCQLVASPLEWASDAMAQARLGHFLVKQVYPLGHASNQAMGDLWVALRKAGELLLGNHHHRAGFAGDHYDAVFLVSEYGHGAEDLVLLYIVDFLAARQRFGVPFDDDEHMIRTVALADQRLVCGEVAEAGGWADFRLLQVYQRIAEQGSLSDQVLQ